MEVTIGEKIVNHHHSQYRDTPHPYTIGGGRRKGRVGGVCFLMRSKDGNFVRRMRKLMIPDIMTSSEEGQVVLLSYNQSLMTNYLLSGNQAFDPGRKTEAGSRKRYVFTAIPVRLQSP